jgi:hypothetical protein
MINAELKIQVPSPVLEDVSPSMLEMIEGAMKRYEQRERIGWTRTRPVATSAVY